MSNINKQALRGQSVEGSYYLAECGHCGEMYPSTTLDGGETLLSGDDGECFCHLCGADDSDIADNGAWGSEAVTAWNYQQKRIEALLDELEAKDRKILKLEKLAEAESVGADKAATSGVEWMKLYHAAEKRIAELERKEQHSERQSVIDALAGSGEEWSNIEEYMQKWDAERASAAGKGE